jgi:integrase
VAQIVKRTTAAGKTKYDVRTRIAGRVVTKTFERRKDADAYATTVEVDKLRGVAIDPRRSQVALRDYANEWLEQRHDLAERTEELYRWLLDRHILPRYGTTSLAAITPSSVRTWNHRIAVKHPTTAAKAYRLLSTIMKTAVADEVISRNPCQVKGASAEKAPERPVASIAEVQALADAMPDELRIAVLMAAWCQLRKAELMGLRRQDVDLLHGKVSISLTRTTRMDGSVVEKAPKSNAGKRTVTVPPNVLPLLAAHMADHVGPEREALVIPVASRKLDTAWNAARREIGLPELRIHDLRHSGLTWSAATGASIAELMRRAGHASPAAAMRYQHATEDRDVALAAALAALAPQREVKDIRRAKDAR